MMANALKKAFSGKPDRKKSNYMPKLSDFLLHLLVVLSSLEENEIGIN